MSPMPTTPSLEPLLRPRSVAIVGASAREGSVGSNIIRNLQAAGFKGRIVPINPRYPEIHGLPCFASLAEVGEPVDAVFIAVAAQYAVDILRQAVAAGARAVLMNGTGFADAGEEGRARQDEVIAIAATAGIPVCGPNNLGLVNLLDGVALWAAEHVGHAEPGPVAVVSQSGSVALALSADPMKLGLSHIITAGNEAVTGVGGYVDALVDDDRVKVILLFLETLRDPAGLARAVARARAAGKPVLAVKVGRSERARAAVAAHSGALSGEDAVVDAFFRRHGIVRARDIDDLVQLAALKLRPPPAPGTQPGYVTLSGGQGAAIADAAADAGLPVRDFPPAVLERLKPLFGGATPQNPFDAWGLGWDPAWFGKVLDELLAAPEIDPVVLALDVPATGDADGPMAVDMARMLAERSFGGKTVLFAANSAISGIEPELASICTRAGMPVLRGTAAALRALAAWSMPAPSAPAGAEADPPALADLAAVHDALRRDISFAESVRVASADEAVAAARRLGFPVAMKGLAPAIAHKTELGLVKLALGDADAVALAYAELERRLGDAAADGSFVEVQPMVPAGIELLVAARRDPAFGPVIVAGAGGKLVELIADSALRLGEVDAGEAARMLAETRIGTLLGGYRDGIAYDLPAATRAIAALSRIMASAPAGVQAIEINPLIVLPAGRGAVAVDLVVE